MGDELEKRRVPVFIAYRQGKDEGDECAAWLHENLHDRSIPIDGEPWSIDTYWDQTAPAVDDWRELWEGDLRTARALIVICTPSAAQRRVGSDWFYEEVGWWVDNRDIGPILVNASDLDPAPVPDNVAEKWGFAQWVAWSDDPLVGERALARIVEGIVLAEQGVRHQELERTLRLLHDAEVARLDALAALNKVEAMRIDSIPDPGAGADERERLHHQELGMLGRKYERQMNTLADRAEALRHEGPPPPSRSLTGTLPPREVFTIEALSREYGSCLLVRYGTTDRERFVLIDGGPDPNYKRSLRPRLLDLQREWAGDEPLELEAVISTQADQPESGGIRRMLEELEELAHLKSRDPSDQEAPRLEIKRFWTNVFDPFPLDEQRTDLGLAVLRIPRSARRLGLPVNKPFDRFVSRPIAGAPRVELEGGLEITVLGPRGDFSQFWVKKVRQALKKRGDLVGEPDLPGVIETCSSPEIYLQPSPLRTLGVEAGEARDLSQTNRTSIVLLLEYARRTALLTSDAVGSDVIRALDETGLLNPDGTFSVDLLSLPHYGSKNNVDAVFFDTLTAPRYLVQCNFRHNNPSPETLAMLAAARGDEPYTVFLTRREGRAKDEHFLTERDRVLAKAAKEGALTTVFPETDAPSLEIDLLS